MKGTDAKNHEISLDNKTDETESLLKPSLRKETKKVFN